jgi:osmotically-inducible protein OsmY
MKVLGLGAAIGALLAFFLDPQSGRRRRATTRDRGLGMARRSAQRAERAGRGVAAEAYGTAQKVKHREEEPKELDDVTLARKVESEVFRDQDAPRGSVNVNVQDGLVQLRGEVERPELIEELVARTRRVQGVRDVENLLHTPGTEAPMHR